MAQYKKIQRPSVSWFIGLIVIALFVFSVLLAASSSWPGILAIGSMLSSALGAFLLLSATWSSIKTREELCLLTISRSDPGDFASVLANMQGEVDKKVFDDLGREWKFNLTGVVLIMMSLGLFWIDVIVVERSLKTCQSETTTNEC